MADLDLLSAGMSAVLGTKVQARRSQEFQRDLSTLSIRADDFFYQEYPIMTPAVEAVSLEIGEMFDLIVTHIFTKREESYSGVRQEHYCRSQSCNRKKRRPTGG